MHFAFDNIGFVTFLLLASGWLSHLYAVLSYITHIKKKRVGFRWYFRNRIAKVKRSIVTSIAAAVMAYVWFYPPALDLAIDDDRKMFAYYMMTIFLTGSGSSLIFDIVGNAMKAPAAKNGGQDYDVVEDGATILATDEDRQKILNKEESEK